MCSLVSRSKYTTVVDVDVEIAERLAGRNCCTSSLDLGRELWLRTVATILSTTFACGCEQVRVEYHCIALGDGSMNERVRHVVVACNLLG